MQEISTLRSHAARSGGIEQKLRTAASALTLAASAIALTAQIVEHFRKPPAGPNERTKAGTALLGLAVLRTLPSLIRSAKSLSADLKRGQ